MKEKILQFLRKYYLSAIKLKENFKITEKKEWDETTVLMELYVQIGHMALLAEKNELLREYSKEQGRNIHDYADEISDVLLQMIALSSKLNVKLIEEIENTDIKNIEICNITDVEVINMIVILLGQVTEAIMENNQFRVKKERQKFKSIDEFISNKLIKSIYLVFKIIDKNGIDIEAEYEKMQKKAYDFLKKYKG